MHQERRNSRRYSPRIFNRKSIRGVLQLKNVNNYGDRRVCLFFFRGAKKVIERIYVLSLHFSIRHIAHRPIDSMETDVK